MFALGAAALLLAGSAGLARSQEAPLRAPHWEVNLHGATLFQGLFDERSGAWQVGGRIVRNTASGLAFGGNVDYALADDVQVVGLGGLSADLITYSFEVDYVFATSPRSRFFLGGGVGGATLQFGEGAPVQVPNSTGLLIPVAAGFKLFNRPVGPSWAFRFDLRDNIIFLETLDDGGETSEEPRSNWELSAGISFLFGDAGARPAPARPAATPPPVPPPATNDTDGDGVADAEDRCVNTPRGASVDEEGCPLPIDTDGDGVEDVRDRCPGTPAGVATDVDGCPLEPAVGEEPAAEPPAAAPAPRRACASDRPWFGTGEAIPFDGRTFVPLGEPEPITEANLEPVGEHDGVPIFVGAFSEPPYTDLWLPVCEPAGSYHLYVEERAP